MLSVLHLPCVPFQVLIGAADHGCFSQLLRMKSVMLIGWNLVAFPSSKNWEFFFNFTVVSFHSRILYFAWWSKSWRGIVVSYVPKRKSGIWVGV